MMRSNPPYNGYKAPPPPYIPPTGQRPFFANGTNPAPPSPYHTAGNLPPPPSYFDAIALPSATAAAAAATALNFQGGMAGKRDPTQIPECMEEVKLWNNHKEREQVEALADFYSIIRAMDRLEKAFIADHLKTTEYETACRKLIAQYKTLQTSLNLSPKDVENFAEENEMDCRAAMSRFSIGLPATEEHGLQSKKSGQSQKLVAECVQHFITAMDSLRLNMVAIDQIFPLINDLVISLNKISSLPADFEAKKKMMEWHKTLGGMKASEELNEEQSRQLLMDLEQSHHKFYESL